MGEASHAAAAREIEAWETLCDELKTAGREVLATAPGDELTGAEGLRYVARLTAAFLRLVTADPVPARQVLAAQPMKVGSVSYTHLTLPTKA